MQTSKFGIYLHIREQKAVRLNSPYWTPSGEDWLFLTPEVNTTLLEIRELGPGRETWSLSQRR